MSEEIQNKATELKEGTVMPDGSVYIGKTTHMRSTGKPMWKGLYEEIFSKPHTPAFDDEVRFWFTTASDVSFDGNYEGAEKKLGDLNHLGPGGWQLPPLHMLFRMHAMSLRGVLNGCDQPGLYWSAEDFNGDRSTARVMQINRKDSAYDVGENGCAKVAPFGHLRPVRWQCSLS